MATNIEIQFYPDLKFFLEDCSNPGKILSPPQALLIFIDKTRRTTAESNIRQMRDDDVVSVC